MILTRENRPSMEVDLEGLPPFSPKSLLKVHQSARIYSGASISLGHGNHNGLERCGTKAVSDKPQVRRRFIRSVHTGYDQAQSAAGRYVIEWGARNPANLERVERPVSPGVSILALIL